MEARIRKIFHRKKDQLSEKPLQRSQRSAAATSSPALRTSLYDVAPQGGTPQTGDYPIKGNNSSAIFHNRRASLRNPHLEDPGINSSYLPPVNGVPQHLKAAPMSTSHNKDLVFTGNVQPYTANRVEKGHEGRSQFHNVHPQEDLSSLNLGDKEVVRSSNQSHPRDHNYVAISNPQHEKLASKQAKQHPTDFEDENMVQARLSRDSADGGNHPLGPQNRKGPSEPLEDMTMPYSGLRTDFGAKSNITAKYPSSPPGNPLQQSPYSSMVDRDSPHGIPQYGPDLAARKSISRKQLGNSARGQRSDAQPLLSTGPVRSADKQNTSTPQRFPARSKLMTTESDAASSAERVVERAQSNTVDTEVIEAIAPAVVHETVKENVHHVREEVITREIHNHDIYHRILPIIDVEVLPARHFLPVEGGGLVEISGSEVPGRGQNWVIAETASKIPSGHSPPRMTNRFSAREFVGDEGDFKSYTTSEGFERTEETWVHPPELETGGRDTGQTWPMVIGNSAADNTISEKQPIRSAAKKHRRKSSLVAPSAAQRSGDTEA